MYQTLDGPSLFDSISVSTTAVEVKVGANRHIGREVVTIQPIDGDVYLGYSSSVTTSNGTLLRKEIIFPLEATDQAEIWLIAASGTVDVRIAELS